MPIFQPPTDNFVRYGDPQAGGVQARLWRFYAPEPRGRNVFLLTDGTFTENDPRDEGLVARIYFGGHDNYVTDAEADALVAAGYTVLPGTFELDSVYSSELDSGARFGN